MVLNLPQYLSKVMILYIFTCRYAIETVHMYKLRNLYHNQDRRTSARLTFRQTNGFVGKSLKFNERLMKIGLFIKY